MKMVYCTYVANTFYGWSGPDSIVCSSERLLAEWTLSMIRKYKACTVVWVTGWSETAVRLEVLLAQERKRTEREKVTL